MSTLAGLPTIPVVGSGGVDPRERDRLIGRAKALSWVSLAWMTVEGGVAIGAALAAGSVALLGFGIDSAIEGLASVVVIWRFTRTDVTQSGVRRLRWAMRPSAREHRRRVGAARLARSR